MTIANCKDSDQCTYVQSPTAHLNSLFRQSPGSVSETLRLRSAASLNSVVCEAFSLDDSHTGVISLEKCQLLRWLNRFSALILTGEDQRTDCIHILINTALLLLKR